MESIDYLRILFDANESSCFTNTKATNVFSVFSSSDKRTEFVCINPLDATKDNQPSKPWHFADVPRRADCNVTVYRNFLFDCDEGSIEEQLGRFSDLRFPFSTAVYSGGKSVHFVLSLETPLNNAQEYNQVAVRLMNKLSSLGVPIDTSTKNPSRLTRLGGAFRAELKKHQTILKLNSRVSRQEVADWYGVGLFEFLTTPKQNTVYTGRPNMRPIFTIEMMQLINYGAPSGQRNNRAFWLCCEIIRRFKALLSADDLLSYIENFDLPYHEKRAIVESARSKMRHAYPKEI